VNGILPSVFSDTSREVDQLQLEIFRRMPPERRLQCGLELTRACRSLMREGVRRRHPEYDERRLREAVIRLTLPEDVFRAAYPDATDSLP
jgi:hypothetical protein